MAKLSLDLLNQFIEAGAKTYESTSIWKVTNVLIPVITIDGEGASLVKDQYGWQVRLQFEGAEKATFVHAEIPKAHHAAAANGYPSWKIDNAKCVEDYRAVALNNGTIISLDEYNKTKDALAQVGVVVATHTSDGKERADKGFIFIPKYDDAKPAKDQPLSVKFVASPV